MTGKEKKGLQRAKASHEGLVLPRHRVCACHSRWGGGVSSYSIAGLLLCVCVHERG